MKANTGCLFRARYNKEVGQPVSNIWQRVGRWGGWGVGMVSNGKVRGLWVLALEGLVEDKLKWVSCASFQEHFGHSLVDLVSWKQRH